MKYIIFITVFMMSTFTYGQDNNVNKEEIKIQNYFDSMNAARDLWIGKTFPIFTLINLDLKKVDNKVFKNKITFVNFWFTGCTPCNVAFTEYNRLNDSLKKFKGKVQFISFTKDILSLAKQTSKKQNFKFQVLPFVKEENNYPDFKSGYPLYLIVNEKGIITYIHSGGYNNINQAKLYFDTEIYPRINKLYIEK